MRRSSLIACILSGCLALLAAHEQTSAPQVRQGSKSMALNRKEAIERHFLSRQPKPLRQLGGATPGARLLDQWTHHIDSLNGRIQRTRVARPATTRTTVTSAAYPGIGLRSSLPAGAIPTAVVAGDFNQDGHMDFVVANGYTNDLWIYLGNGDGTFQLPRIVPLSKGLSPVYLAAADLRGDGDLDLIVAEFDTWTVGVLLGNGDGTFGYEQEFALPQPPAAVVVDDFNHDGKPDIGAVMDSASGSFGNAEPYIAFLAGDGTGKFAAPVLTMNTGLPSSALSISSGDVNGDGLPDVLITGPGYENSQVFVNEPPPNRRWLRVTA